VPWRGEVLSVAHLTAHDGRPLIDTTTEPSGTSGRQRLTNPPWHLSSPPEVHEVRTRHGMFRYVWMLSNEKSAQGTGGMVFLPVPGAADLRVVTFNTGPLEPTTRICTNAHHAETQLISWVGKQREAWGARIGSLRIDNRSRRGRNRGYSPCKACCADLVRFVKALNALPRPAPVKAFISWERLYDGGVRCKQQHRTENGDLRDLMRSGWGIMGPTPPGFTPPPAPVPPIRRPRVYTA